MNTPETQYPTDDELKRDFEIFKTEFQSHIARFNLADFRFIFQHEKLDDSWARIIINHMGRVATVSLTSTPPKDKLDDYNPARHAKHEAIHALIGRLRWLACCRYVTESEIEEEDERLVRLLEQLL
jgi:hypothetical protein